MNVDDLIEAASTPAGEAFHRSRKIVVEIHCGFHAVIVMPGERDVKAQEGINPSPTVVFGGVVAAGFTILSSRLTTSPSRR